jgi:dynein heavy chain
MLLHEHSVNAEEASKNKHLKHWLLVKFLKIYKIPNFFLLCFVSKCSTVFGCIWSVGATSDADSRVKFDAFFRELIKGKHPEYPAPESCGKLEFAFPDTGLVYDYFYVVR